MRGRVLAIALWGLGLALAAFGAPTQDPEPTPTARAIRLTLRFHHTFDGAPLRFNEVSLKNQAGNRLSVSRLAYLLSNVTLLRADGGTVVLDNQYGYIDPASWRTAFALANAPPGRYAGLSFQIGLLPETNHADPAGYAAGHPLHPLTNHLHWGWQGGYVFLALEGRYTQRNGRLGGYVYHLANDRNLMTVTLKHAMTLDADSTVDLQFDLARVFDAVSRITVRPENGADSTHSAESDKLSEQIKANVERSFTFEGIELLNNATQPPRVNAASPLPPATASRAPHTTPYSLSLPAHFPEPSLPPDNPLTVEGVSLGKRLFSEKRLSGDNTQSCASCHHPENAFSDRGKALSAGIDGQKGMRRAMPLFNLAWSPSFTWDGRRARLRDQALAPIQDVREMHLTLERAVAKLKSDRVYPNLFAAAFGSPGITPARIGLAVEQYLYTLISADSKFDRALNGEAQFTQEEKRGLLLFITEYDPARGKIGADCFHCHGGNLFTDYQFKNNGLDSKFRDEGRFRVTHNKADKGKFKTPSLRNVEITGPYMHDGRFKTLEQVIDHYTSGIRPSDTLDPNIAKHPDDGMKLSDADKKALVAFLKTLTDRRFQPASRAKTTRRL